MELCVCLHGLSGSLYRGNKEWKDMGYEKQSEMFTQKYQSYDQKLYVHAQLLEQSCGETEPTDN